MATTRILPEETRSEHLARTADAIGLAGRLPRLAIEARRIATGALHGVHGRRRAGVGENFWQFRAFMNGEPAHRIDWRRSARDDGRHFVREREWEAAHTVWIWIDRSRSMDFESSLARAPKIDRAIVLGLALADCLVRGGERVGLLGLTNPLASRSVADKLAEALASDHAGLDAALPPAITLAPLTETVLITDALSPPDEIAKRIEVLSARGARGHLVRIVDPVEEIFPFDGQTELIGVEDRDRLDIGDAKAFRARYQERMESHNAALREACARRGWSFDLHRTDRNASEALLALSQRVAMPNGQSGRR